MTFKHGKHPELGLIMTKDNVEEAGYLEEIGDISIEYCRKIGITAVNTDQLSMVVAMMSLFPELTRNYCQKIIDAYERNEGTKKLN